jgi:large subunit ribosomal protein L18
MIPVRFPATNVSEHGISRTYIPDIEPDCWKSNIMAPLVRSASHFLFPCTVEYSLLCAVILGVMWMNACSNKSQQTDPTTPDTPPGRVSGVNIIYTRSISHFSVDCTSAHKGLFAGILVLVLSIVSLIMFFELVQRPQYVDEAVFQVSPSIYIKP